MASSNKLGFKRDDTSGALMVQGLVDLTNGQPGLSTPQFSVNKANSVLAANRAYVNRFWTPRPMTVASIAAHLAVASTTDDACDVGIYTVTNSTTLGKLVTAGATTGKLNGALGLLSVPLVASLDAFTIYYVAFSVGAIGGTVPQLLQTSLVQSSAPVAFGSTTGVFESGVKDASHVLPASLVIGAGTTTATPVLHVREV